MKHLKFTDRVKLAFDVVFRPYRVKYPQEVTIDRSIVRNLEGRISHFENTIKGQQKECANLIQERDVLWALLQEARGEKPIIPEEGLTVKIYDDEGNIGWRFSDPIKIKK